MNPEEKIAIIDGCLYNEETGEVCILGKFGQKIVRCKNCKHYFRNDRGCVVTYECELLHERMRDDFFCADGERKEK